MLAGGVWIWGLMGNGTSSANALDKVRENQANEARDNRTILTE